MSSTSFNKLVAELQRRGYTLDVAEVYASLLGDTIEVDQDGQWVIRDDKDQVIDRIPPLE